MNETKWHFSLAEASPLSRLTVSFLSFISIGFILFVISFFAGVLIFRVELSSLSDKILTDGKVSIAFLRYLTVAEQLSFFVIPALYLLKQLSGPSGKITSYFPVPSVRNAVLVILLAFCLFPVTIFAGKLNSGMHFPEWLSGIEKWMTDKEDAADSLLSVISAADTFGVLMLNLIILALIPAVGEEMVFRGIFQPIFQKLFRNCHFGIWFTAFVFSAVHLQFFGFLPRFILGLVFGYLYYRSGTLWLPVTAHFVNNAVPVIGAFLVDSNKITAQPDDASLLIQLLILTAPVVIAVLIMLHFRKEYIARR
jgi:uncharacterized protein